jgi:hypothetical protein
VKAVYSADFNDLSHECIERESGRHTCWEDIAPLYKEDEECSLYGETWLCYHQIQDAWQHGDCLWVEHIEVCGENFYDMAERRCTKTPSGVELCPRAFGVREVNPQQLQPPTYHQPGASHIDNLYASWADKELFADNWCGGHGLAGAHCESAYDCHGCTCVNQACYVHPETFF